MNKDAEFCLLSCKRCLYTNYHPLGLTLDTEGICSGCRIHEEKDKLDWNSRWEKLKDLVAPYRIDSGSTYDCIVPVTGANDSYFIVHLVKERLGLNPLLVTYNKYFNTPRGIDNLANLRIRFNCDIIYQNVNPISVKKITRSTLRAFGSMYWPCLAGQTVFPVQTAVRFKIPLIIWGAHQGLEQVGMFSHNDEVEMTRRYRKEHDLMGFEADDLLSIFDTLTEDDIWQYRYPDDASLDSGDVRGIYLGNYVRWDPLEQHKAMVQQYAYGGSEFTRTFDIFDHVDCFNYSGLHDHIKMVKHGYSKVTDHACREIRYGRISRSEGLMLKSYYEQKPVTNIEKFCKWLDLHPRSLSFVIDQHRNDVHWEKSKDQVWRRRHTEVNPSASRSDVLQLKRRLALYLSGKIASSNQSHYITIGKGWPV